MNKKEEPVMNMSRSSRKWQEKVAMRGGPSSKNSRGVKQSAEEEIGRGRESPQHYRRVAEESSEAGPKPEAE